MTFSIAIRTIPARAELFCQLACQVADIMADPGVLGLHVSARADVTPNENACLALAGAAGDEADWVLFLEDDAGPIDDLIGSVDRWLADHEDPAVHVYPLGYQYDADASETAWEYPISAFYCSVALVIRTSMVPSLIAYLRANSHVRQGFDLMTGHWHRTASDSPDLLAPVPCFVEHLGDESTLIDGRPGHNVVGRFRGFSGYDYSYAGQTERVTRHG